MNQKTCVQESRIQDIREDVREIKSDVKTLVKTINDNRIDISVLKAKAGFFGFIAGILPTIIGHIMDLFGKHK